MKEWTDIGTQLRKARENKDLELSDVAQSTRIPLATLAALEESDYSIFPSPAYARSFLAQYSEFLGVNADEWIDAFETGDVLANMGNHGIMPATNIHIGGPSPRPVTNRRSNGTSPSSKDPSSAPNSARTPILQTLTVFLITGLLIGGGIIIYQKYEPNLKGSATDNIPDITASPQTDIKEPLQETTPPLPPQASHLPPPLQANNDPSPIEENNLIEVIPKEPATDKPQIRKPAKAIVVEEHEE
ncbi:MAG: helix-turn-helix domain-containing protein [Verrucomicrobiae bacterium]|nr:helix-turn-helix domain-containing protein [Verrucomicrobiae bacterium]NNJ43489.1 helix-turn-helix domain-containing protein [Akkermansiaceae bacterium]